MGRTADGGEGNSIDCDGDGKPDATFETDGRFVLQLREGKILAVESDRDNVAHIGGKRIALKAYAPVILGDK